MKKTITLPAFVLMLFSMTSCLFDNDLSYPDVSAEITDFKVEGQVSVRIDAVGRTVSVELAETADLSRIKVSEIAVSAGSEIVGGVPEYLDLTSPVTMLLKAYVEDVWTISASQPVVRYIRTDNQIGEAEFDVPNRSAIVYVTGSQSLKSVVFNEMKLEREGSSVVSTTGIVVEGTQTLEETQDCVFPMTLECVMLRKFTVEDAGGTVDWIVRVLNKDVPVEVTSVNAWATHAYVTGLFDGTGEPYIEYRETGSGTWTTVIGAVVEGTGISADFHGLQPSASYEVRIVNGEEASDIFAFETEAAAQVPNMSFDDWYASDPSAAKTVWYPYTSAADQAWDSANPGAATFIGSSTVPEESFVISGKAARLESKYAVIAFAAGNIYTGRFDKIAGVGAELDWGYPFTSRPSALKGWYSYSPKPIDKADASKLAAGGLSADELLGKPDRCQILVILADWDSPFHVNTTKGQFVDIGNDEHVIAYGVLETDEPTGGEYKEFTIDLQYRTRTRRPNYVVISACASYLGDYFTGGVGSTMFVDEFEFIYE